MATLRLDRRQKKIYRFCKSKARKIPQFQKLVDSHHSMYIKSREVVNGNGDVSDIVALSKKLAGV